jgi:hypothetical protein
MGVAHCPRDNYNLSCSDSWKQPMHIYTSELRPLGRTGPFSCSFHSHINVEHQRTFWHAR